MVLLLAAEAVRWTEQVDGTVAEACWMVMRMDDTSVDRGIEPYLERAWRLRAMSVRQDDDAK